MECLDQGIVVSVESETGLELVSSGHRLVA